MNKSGPVSGIIPEKSRGEGGSAYGFHLLVKPGDSVFIPHGDLKRVSSALTYRRKSMRTLWTCRTILDGKRWGKEYSGVPGIAVWYFGRKT